MNTFKFQNKKNKDYFEGWYTRFTSKDNVNFAVIFAITKDQNNPHSFIQIFKDNDKKCTYLSYPIDSFKYDYKEHLLSIGPNILSLTKLIIKDQSIDIDINLSNLDTLTKYEGSDSAMGYLSKAPLECFQEVIFLDANINGTILYKQKSYSIEGKGYMEKTYGTNFPSKWIWIQSNHNTQNASLSFSVGLIPVGLLRPKGFLALLRFKGKLYRFYSGNFSSISLDDKTHEIIVKRGNRKLIIKPQNGSTVELVGPRKKGVMNLPVFESINSVIDVELLIKKETIFIGEFINTGYEQMFFNK